MVGDHGWGSFSGADPCCLGHSDLSSSPQEVPSTTGPPPPPGAWACPVGGAILEHAVALGGDGGSVTPRRSAPAPHTIRQALRPCPSPPAATVPGPQPTPPGGKGQGQVQALKRPQVGNSGLTVEHSRSQSPGTCQPRGLSFPSCELGFQRLEKVPAAASLKFTLCHPFCVSAPP